MPAWPLFQQGELELRRGRREVARAHFETALGLARNDEERRFGARRLEALRVVLDVKKKD